MAKFGKKNQPVTANSTTLTETTQGAPIGTQALVKGGKAQNISHSVNAHFGNTSPGSRASVDFAMFGNTTPGAFIDNQTIGVFSVNASSTNSSITHSGWVLTKTGSGPVVSITYTGNATGYSNTDVGIVASPQLGGNASFSMSTNSTGGALTLKIVNPGKGFKNKSLVNSDMLIANSTGGISAGSGAVFSGVVGGRAGRVQNETLIAQGSNI